MSILTKDEIDHLQSQISYEIKSVHEDKLLNELLNVFLFLDENMDYLLASRFKAKDILYSKYYYYLKYKNSYVEVYGNDEGIEQKQYKLLEEMDQLLTEGIDWNCIQNMESETSIDRNL